MCDFEQKCPFWQKNLDKSIQWVNFHPTVTPVILQFIANFLTQCFDMPSELPGMKEKMQSYVFKSDPGSLRAQRPMQINMEIDVLFSYCHGRPSDSTTVCKVLQVPFERGISIDMYYQRKFWSINAIEVVLVFSKKKFKPVNMCLDHTHDKIAVQNNALISSIIFTLKQAKIAVQNNALMSSIIFTLKQAKIAVQNNALISSIIFTLKRAKIAVQNNALISSVIFTLKQANRFDQLSPM